MGSFWLSVILKKTKCLPCFLLLFLYCAVLFLSVLFNFARFAYFCTVHNSRRASTVRLEEKYTEKSKKRTIFKSTGLTWENGEGRQTKVPALTGASGLCILNTGNYLPSGTPHHTKCEPTQTIVRSIVLVLGSTHCLEPKCCNGLTQNHKVSPMLQKKVSIYLML